MTEGDVSDELRALRLQALDAVPHDWAIMEGGPTNAPELGIDSRWICWASAYPIAKDRDAITGYGDSMVAAYRALIAATAEEFP
jgi:hypothetical protein